MSQIGGPYAEDADYSNGSTMTVLTTAGHFRAGYGRCSVAPSGVSLTMKSLVFPGGPVTSFWVTAQLYNASATVASQRFFGLMRSGTNGGLFIGTSAASATRLALQKYDGTTLTELATEVGNSVFTSAGLHRLDMQVVSYGTTATVNVFWDGVLLIPYSGNVTVSGVADLDQVANFRTANNYYLELSEVYVCSEDSRGKLGFVTMAGNNNGTTQQFTNPAYTNWNPTTITDANSTYSNTVGQDEQATLIDLPSGTFVVEGVRVVARAYATAGATATKLKLGVANGAGTAAVAAAHALTTSPASYEDFFATNPVTSAPWGDATEMNALQLNLRSAS